MPTAQLGDVGIYYEEKGHGEAVLLVPPSWWPSDTWKVVVVPFLSQHYKTIIFDCRGAGRSSKPKHGYTVSQFAQDCLALLAHLGISRCHAVGYALGGQIVQAMAIERPNLVATATIAGAGPGSRTLSGGPRNFRPIPSGKFANWGLRNTSAPTWTTTEWRLTLRFIVSTATLLRLFPMPSGRDKPQSSSFATTKSPA